MPVSAGGWAILFLFLHDLGLNLVYFYMVYIFIINRGSYKSGHFI